MRIGFDAKRAFLNKSGLGSYSRNLIGALSTTFPEEKLFLYTTNTNTSLFDISNPNVLVRTPENLMGRTFPSIWRSYGVSGMLIRDRIDIYHGLSHEIPYRFPDTKVKSVVTIHDLIFLKLPRLYKAIDRHVYENKFRYACKKADRIIAISRQTAADIVNCFGIGGEKIDVIYQGCHPKFYTGLSADERIKFRKKYDLPESYILYVGTIEERKNLLTLIRALDYGKIQIPLIVIGRKTAYAKDVFKFLSVHGGIKVHFHEVVANTDLPAFYQLAEVFVYPSVYEGFGIPILEALASKTPVVTSIGGCFREAGGPDSLYVEPMNHQGFAEAIKKILSDATLRKHMTETGYLHALDFREESVARLVMNVYKKVLQYE
jgi:glycosyltransferase involved in cell wall biosynthesis